MTLDFIAEAVSTTHVYLENIQAFKLTTDADSNSPSLWKKPLAEATANATGDYSEELVTGAPDEPSPSMENHEFI